MVRVAERGLVSVLPITERVAVPLPEPELVVVIQVTALDAFQEQPAVVVTATVSVPPLAPMEAPLEASV